MRSYLKDSAHMKMACIRRYEVQVAAVEWKRQWDSMTPEEQRQHSKERAAQWKRHWDSLTPEQQQAERRAWVDARKRQQDSLTPKRQEAQRRNGDDKKAAGANQARTKRTIQ